MEPTKRMPVRKKGLKGFLLVEFRRDNLVRRLRFKVFVLFSGYEVQVKENRWKRSGDGRFRKNRKCRIEVGDCVSERQLFRAVAEYISAKEKIPTAAVAFRWENGSLFGLSQ